jgi:hypothetical protein
VSTGSQPTVSVGSERVNSVKEATEPNLNSFYFKLDDSHVQSSANVNGCEISNVDIQPEETPTSTESHLPFDGARRSLGADSMTTGDSAHSKIVNPAVISPRSAASQNSGVSRTSWQEESCCNYSEVNTEINECWEVQLSVTDSGGRIGLRTFQFRSYIVNLSQTTTAAQELDVGSTEPSIENPEKSWRFDERLLCHFDVRSVSRCFPLLDEEQMSWGDNFVDDVADDLARKGNSLLVALSAPFSSSGMDHSLMFPS